MIQVVTTMNAAGWQEYGQRMVQSYLEHWPDDIPLAVYSEGFVTHAVEDRDLPKWQADFKERHRDNPDAHGHGQRKPYKRQAVRFSHKVGAICDAASRLGKGDWLIWLDADTFTHSRVTKEWLESLVSDPFMIALLQRKQKHSECGFMIWDMDHISTSIFFDTIQKWYDTDRIFNFPETHDSYIIDQVINSMHMAMVLPPSHVINLSGPNNDRGHVFVKSRLAECLDHRKGPLKRKAHTPISSVGMQYRSKFRSAKW